MLVEVFVSLKLQIREGLHYNPYFPGGAIAMPKMLIDGAVEYEDGTPATEAQVLIQSPICKLSLSPNLSFILLLRFIFGSVLAFLSSLLPNLPYSVLS